ncbi:MAG: PKD domain-containing protein [Bacteroidales bacterium]
MKKINFLLIFIFLLFPDVEAQTKLVQYEYWFNADYGNSQVVTITPTPQHQLVLDIDASALPEGVNVLNIRYKDENGFYSSILSKMFYKNPDELIPGKLASYEYWYNNDYGNSHKETLTPDSQHLLALNVDASALSDGVNVLNIRYKDENGFYSSTLSKLFYKNPDALVSSKLQTFEYWFNNDYSNKQRVEISPAPQHQLIADLNATTLPGGVNVLHIRYQDENGIYSSTLSKVFYKMEHSPLGNNELIAYQYWYGDEYEDAVYVQIQDPVQQVHLLTDLDMTHLPKGDYALHFQFLDSNGLWSGITTDSISKTLKPEAAFSISSTAFCAGSNMSFVNESIDADAWSWDFGDGGSSEAFEPEHVYSTAGSYQVSLTVTNSEDESQSSVVTSNLIVNPVYSHVQEISITEGESYDFAGNTYTQTGEYKHTFTTVQGCDSLVTLLLEVKASGVSTHPVTEPAILVYPNPTTGKVYLKPTNMNGLEVEVSVFDRTGRKILSSRKKLSDDIVIDLSGQIPGTYYLKVESEGIRKTYQVIVKP